MGKSVTKKEVEARLKAKKEAIDGRINAIQEEVTTTRTFVKKAVLGMPLLGIGASMLGGVMIGWLLGGLGRRRRPLGEDIATTLLKEGYLDRVVEEANRALTAGMDPSEAFRKSLLRHGPLVVGSLPPEVRQKGSLLRKTVRSLGSMAANVVLRQGSTFLLAKLQGDKDEPLPAVRQNGKMFHPKSSSVQPAEAEGRRGESRTLR